MIQLCNVSKWYPTHHGRHYVFRDVSLTVPAGRGLAILGRNGAGKSTLVRMLGGIEYANRGTVRVVGSISWPLGLQLGLQGALTGRFNARFAARVLGLSEVRVAAVEAFVEEVADIGHHFDLAVNTYSSGMRARVGFAISMAFRFDYYLIDEALEVGDAKFQQKSAEMIKQRLANSSVILVSHDEVRARELCRAAILLWDGKVEYFDDVHEAYDTYHERLAGLPSHMRGLAMDA